MRTVLSKSVFHKVRNQEKEMKGITEELKKQ